MRFDGGDLRRLTPAGFATAWPSWSPDGRRLVFVHPLGAHSGGEPDLYVVGDDARGFRLLVRGGDDPAWSPGGERIAYSASLWTRIDTVAPNGGNVQAATDSHDDCELYTQPAWSPDGERLAFTADTAGGECGGLGYLGVTRGQGGHGVLVPLRLKEPDWAPDGRRIAASWYDGAAWRIGIYDVRTRRLLRGLGRGRHPRFSPDGRSVVFVRDRGPSSELTIVNVDGSGLRPLTR